MSQSKNIEPMKNRAEYHGYVERYHDNGNLKWQGVFVDGHIYGYHKDYNYNGSIWEDWTGYFMNDKKVSNDNEEGCCYIWSRTEK